MLISRCTLRGLKRDGVDAVQQNAAGGGLEQARDELDDGRLAGAVLADERERLASADRERHVGQHVAIGQRIAEADAIELDRVDRPAPLFACVEVARRQLEKLEQVAHVEQALVDAGDAVEQRR